MAAVREADAVPAVPAAVRPSSVPVATVPTSAPAALVAADPISGPAVPVAVVPTSVPAVPVADRTSSRIRRRHREPRNDHAEDRMVVVAIDAEVEEEADRAVAGAEE